MKNKIADGKMKNKITGVQRIRTACKKNGNLVKFSFGEEDFFIRIYSRKTVENVTENQVDARLTQELSDKEKEIFSFIIQNKKITSTDLQKLLGISREMANRYFKKLIDKKLIIRKGIGKSTYYTLIGGLLNE